MIHKLVKVRGADFCDDQFPIISTIGRGPKGKDAPIPMKFADPIEWDINSEYDSFTVVMYDGNSYTSKQSVPIGVDISDDEYWVLSGPYNAQIEACRRETAHALQVAQDAQDDIDALSSTFVYVSDYGAVGNGVTDDLQAIQSAINACAENEDKKYIVFDEKEYFISDVLMLNNCSFVSFIGNGCTIKHDHKSGIYVYSNCHDIYFYNMIFHGGFEPNDTETGSNSCIGIGANSNTALYEAYNISIDHCKFIAGVFGVAASNVLNLNITNCAFEGCVYRPEDGAGGYAILEQSCVNVLIENCFFKIGDYGRHDIYVSVLQPKTDNRQSKNIKIINCISDRSEMQTQSSGAFFSTTTVRIAVRACVDLHIDGFYAIDGTGIVSINNYDGDAKNVVVENIYQTDAKYISSAIAPHESRAAINILGTDASNYSEINIKNLKLVNAASLYLDINGEADKIIVEDMIVNYRMEINTSVKDTNLILNNVGLQNPSSLQYVGTGVLHGHFTNLYNASSSVSMSGGACSNDSGKIDINCYELAAKVFRITSTGVFTWYNDSLVHPWASVDNTPSDYKILSMRYATKPLAGMLAPFGAGVTGFYDFDTTHDADATNARIYTYDVDGTVNKNKSVIGCIL